MSIDFRDIPEKRNLEIYQATQFKQTDGTASMSFAERLEIHMKVTRIANEDAREELRELMRRTLDEAKKIIAAHEDKTLR